MSNPTCTQLTEAQTRRFRELLETKAAELHGSLRSFDEARETAGVRDTADEGDEARRNHEEWVFLSRNNIDRMLLREIEEALRSIEEGSYGVCMECGEGISSKRLEAIPWAHFCISCQEQLSGDSRNSRERQPALVLS